VGLDTHVFSLGRATSALDSLSIASARIGNTPASQAAERAGAGRRDNLGTDLYVNLYEKLSDPGP
jgi:hypothetical protein